VATAISHVFEGNVEQAARAYRPVYGLQIQDGNVTAAAATANALGRIYLEAGELANARKWYDGARDLIAGARGLPEAEALLWDMRYQHALARIAARGERPDDAKQAVAAFVKLMKQRGMPKEDGPIHQYLLGYVAYYARDYRTAVAELQKADLRDPFVTDLLGRAYEDSGDLAAAREQYRKTLESTQHSLQNAIARPHAQSRLTAIGR
jgi:tetratricopeptide (TPR) repeat protein